MSDTEAMIVRAVGRVQGVNYRAWAQGTARSLGVGGWIRNEPDGSVKALLTGPTEAVGRMVEAMREGPGAADVRDVTTEPADPADAAATAGDFRVER